MLSQTLTAEYGEADLLIRTGGEKRLSDFLLWELAYAELHFTDRMWPDFGSRTKHFFCMLEDHRRDLAIHCFAQVSRTSPLKAVSILLVRSIRTQEFGTSPSTGPDQIHACS